MLERVREDVAALRLVGVRPSNLGFLQAGYRDGDQDVGAVVKQIIAHARLPGPLYAPAGIGGHPDHLTVRDAALELLRRGHSIVLYGELPYCASHGWPHWVVGTEPDPYLDVTYDWRRYLDGGGLSVKAENAVVETLAPDRHAEKLAAVRSYRSQYSGLQRLLDQGNTLRYEVYWPLEAPMLGSLASLHSELLWKLGVRRGSWLERSSRNRALRRLRPKDGSLLGRLLRQRPPTG